MNSQILIEPIIDGVAHKNIIQGKKFSFGLRFTNLSESPSDSFGISKIKIGSSEGKGLEDDFSKSSFLVKPLVSKEVFYVCIGENGSFLTGLLNIQLDFNIEDGKIFEFYQKNPFTQATCIPHPGNKENFWVDFLYADAIRDILQNRTNNLIKLLTIATLILGVPQFIQMMHDYFFTI